MAGICPPDLQSYARAFRAFKDRVGVVEELSGYAEGGFGFTGDAEADLLSTTAVHPMSEDDMTAFLAKAGAEPGLADDLVARGSLKKVRHGGRTFYVRRGGET
jgi:hypothetical protein